MLGNIANIDIFNNRNLSFEPINAFTTASMPLLWSFSRSRRVSKSRAESVLEPAASLSLRYSFSLELLMYTTKRIGYALENAALL